MRSPAASPAAARTQALQVTLQQRVIDPVLGSDRPINAPWLLRLFNRLPVLQRIPERLVGLGFRPEHVRSPSAALAQS